MNAYGSLDVSGWTFENVIWLLDTGEDLDRIAARLGTSPGAIIKAARDTEQPELVAKVRRGWMRLS